MINYYLNFSHTQSTHCGLVNFLRVKLERPRRNSCAVGAHTTALKPSAAPQIPVRPTHTTITGKSGAVGAPKSTTTKTVSWKWANFVGRLNSLICNSICLAPDVDTNFRNGVVKDIFYFSKPILKNTKFL